MEGVTVLTGGRPRWGFKKKYKFSHFYIFVNTVDQTSLDSIVAGSDLVVRLAAGLASALARQGEVGEVVLGALRVRSQQLALLGVEER